MSASSETRRSVRLPADVDLHARPAGQLVKAASGYDASITLRARGKQADAKSILQVLSLGATGGSEVEVEACGSEASAALDAVAGLLETLS